MNYLAHAYRFLDRPQFVAGTALPDWMNVVDRKNRPRRQLAQPLLADRDPDVAELAAGVIQHHDDDRWFHTQSAFVELSTQFAVELRQHLPPGGGHQAGFLGHILVELLLDAALIQRDPQLLQHYYELLDQLDVHCVQASANRILRTAEQRLIILIPRFTQERFLADYTTESGLQYRLSGVMRRVGLPPLPDLTAWLLTARHRVYQSADQLLPSANRSSNTGH
ncbi:MAG: hypothetical protein KF752_16200 [Pirellulaceae bacterium]|nr:hypothetical protein [Pirellulaceae bacterium]